MNITNQIVEKHGLNSEEFDWTKIFLNEIGETLILSSGTVNKKKFFLFISKDKFLICDSSL